MARQCASLQQLGEAFDAATCDWDHVKTFDLHNHCLKAQLQNKKLNCGTILSHAQNQVNSFRQKIGFRICCFKIGVTSNPLNRFASYLQRGYTCMWLIGASHSADLISMLEASLIHEFAKHVGCHNQLGSGGEGALNRESPPPPPYFIYITGGRADQNRRVGWEGGGVGKKKRCKCDGDVVV